MERNSRKRLKLLRQHGWVLVRVTGDHHILKHPTKPGRVVVPHPKKDLGIGLVQSILKDAGLQDRGTT